MIEQEIKTPDPVAQMIFTCLGLDVVMKQMPYVTKRSAKKFVRMLKFFDEGVLPGELLLESIAICRDDMERNTEVS